MLYTTATKAHSWGSGGWPGNGEVDAVGRIGMTAVAVLLSLAVAAQARSLQGVEVPEVFSVEGQALTLNGAGARKSFLFTAYVAALYLEASTGDAAVASGEDRVKALTLRFIRAQDRGDLAELFQDGFFNNAQEQLPQIQGRLDRLLALFPDGVGEGQLLTFAYQPGQGTRVTVGDREAVLEGADFMVALWAVWLGDVPVDHGLKRALLGQP